MAIRARLIGRHSPARILGGRLKFRSSQFIANHSVPIVRSLRRIDEPIAEGHLFVLAHPRSGSTVLSHVLHGHPDITGFGEHHVDYETPADLDALEARSAYFAHDPRLATTYVLDKLVLNEHTMSPEILNAPTTRFVFLVREPEATLQSYARMFPDLSTDHDRFRSYRRRLAGLVGNAQLIDDASRSFFLTYAELTTNTEAVLAAMTEWLGLESPLQPDYELTSKTGVQSWGDPSENIKAGTILRVEREADEIDPDVSETADQVFSSTVATLRTLATTITGRPGDLRSPAPTPEQKPPMVAPQGSRSLD